MAGFSGAVDKWRLINADEHSLRAWALPSWTRVKRPIVPAEDLMGADPAQAMLFVRDLPPIRARSISADGPLATFLSSADLTPAAHDWDAPPAVPDTSKEGVVASSPETPKPASSGVAIRAALTRRAPPKPKARAS
jgi:hypothetical protein